MAEIKTIREVGLELDYFSFGNGDKTLVILPGLSIKSVMLSAEGIVDAYSPYTKDYTVYVLDRNRAVSEGVTIRELAEAAIKAMDILGLKDCCIFGASMGGMLAQLIAILRPELVSKLVLGSTTSRPVGDGAAAEWAKKAAAKDVKGLVDGFLAGLYSQGFTERYGDAIRASHSNISEEELRLFLAYLLAADGLDIYERLTDISCPVFVIGVWGDRVVGADASIDIARRLGCSLFMYEKNYGHCVFDEAPDYRSRIFNFFDS